LVKISEILNIDLEEAAGAGLDDDFGDYNRIVRKYKTNAEIFSWLSVSTQNKLLKIAEFL